MCIVTPGAVSWAQGLQSVVLCAKPCSAEASSAVHQLAVHALKHLPNVKTRFYCPQAFLTLHFWCRDDISE